MFNVIVYLPEFAWIQLSQVSPTTMQTTVLEMKAGMIQDRAKQAFHGNPEQTLSGEVTRTSRFQMSQEKTGNPGCNHGEQVGRIRDMREMAGEVVFQSLKVHIGRIRHICLRQTFGGLLNLIPEVRMDFEVTFRCLTPSPETGCHQPTAPIVPRMAPRMAPCPRQHEVRGTIVTSVLNERALQPHTWEPAHCQWLPHIHQDGRTMIMKPHFGLSAVTTIFHSRVGTLHWWHIYVKLAKLRNCIKMSHMYQVFRPLGARKKYLAGVGFAVVPRCVPPTEMGMVAFGSIDFCSTRIRDVFLHIADGSISKRRQTQ